MKTNDMPEGPYGNSAIEAALATCTSAKTLRNYRRDWAAFQNYCTDVDLTVLPATEQTVVGYLAYLSEAVNDGGERRYAAATIITKLAAIKYVHRRIGAIANDPQTGTAQRPLWANIAIQDAQLSIEKHSRTAEAERSVPRMAIRRSQVLDMVACARADARTWEDWFLERRDSAAILIVSATGLGRSEAPRLQIRDVYRHNGVWWLNIARIHEKSDHLPVRISTSDDVNLCAPCAWTRWVDVLVTNASAGRVGLIRLLANDERPQRHRCHKPVDTGALADTDPMFPGSRRAQIRDKPMAGTAFHDTVRRRFACAYPQTRLAGYGMSSLRLGYLHDAIAEGRGLKEIVDTLDLTNLRRQQMPK